MSHRVVAVMPETTSVAKTKKKLLFSATMLINGGWLDPARTAITAAISIGLQYPYIPYQIFGEKGCELGRDITGNEAGSARPLVLHDLISAVVTTCKLGLQLNEVCDHV